MSRNASGTYSLPSGNPVVAGTVIEATWANTTMPDIATELTDSLSRSGKGGMSASLQLTDGSVSAPSTKFTSESQLGFYRKAAATLAAGAGGTEMLSLAAALMEIAGRLIVGTDTQAGDAAAVGYTAAEGLVLTGQGSTYDVVVKNDADGSVLQIPTGTINLEALGDLDVVGDVTAGTITADGDTAAGDPATMGYTAAEGLILTGQGSTNDLTVKNDDDTVVMQVPTGGTLVDFPGKLQINSFDEDQDTVGNSGTIDLDLNVATVFATGDLDGQTVTFTFSNPGATGRASCFTLVMHDADGATITWPTGVDWPDGAEPAWSDGDDIATFITYDGGTRWFGMVGGRAFA